MASSGGLDIGRLWLEAVPYDRFSTHVESLQNLWSGVYRTARIPDWALTRARAAGQRHLLCITEDWCWDAANTVPVVAKLCDACTNMELRVLRRDAYPEVMDRYLTGGSRAIPIVAAFDEAFQELGHWGPRPAEIQAWARAHREGMEKSDFYAQLRRLYVKDRGESTLREVVSMIEVRP